MEGCWTLIGAGGELSQGGVVKLRGGMEELVPESRSTFLSQHMGLSAKGQIHLEARWLHCA